ncbi:MAG: hypothetical protein GF308_22125 [Candidatus Heimdallarchaeota archaeon]|nr:hypothetical protein [Candidatus Heimdallarchaeota archaeon]
MNKWSLVSLIIILGIMSAGLGVMIGYFVFRDINGGEQSCPPGPWQGPPEGWYEIGVPMYDNYQNFVSFGDFTGNGSLEMVGCYSHGDVGVFRHFQDKQDNWQVEPIHERFNHEGNRSYTWPVKGIKDADVDGDGYREVVSLADVVHYPPNHGGVGRHFPGAIYIDPNEGTNWEPKPLFTGAWAENLTGGIMVIPSFVPRSFSGSLQEGYHILVTCNREYNDKNYGHVFLLEQPEEGFHQYDYRYITKDLMGSEPFDQEPFYLKRFWLYNSVSDRYQELYWDPTEVTISDRVQARALVTNLYDDSEGLDLVMWGTYRGPNNAIMTAKVVFYRRIAGDANHTYAFQEQQTWWADGVEFFPANVANIDGNAANGDEAIVIALSNGDPINGIGLNGFIYLTKEGNSWSLKTIDFNYDWPYPYIGVYSSPQPWDYNQDGFDDVALYASRSIAGSYSWGDVLVFQNLGNDFGAISTGQSRFNISALRPVVLWGNDSVTADFNAYDFDEDGKEELIVSCPRRDPYEGGDAHGGSGSNPYKVFYYKSDQATSTSLISFIRKTGSSSNYSTNLLLREEFLNT